MTRKKKKSKKFKMRATFNVANFTHDPPPLKKRISKNMLLQCTKCYHVSLMTIDRAFKGVRCPKCDRHVIADPHKQNYKIAPRILNTDTIPIYRINTVRF